MTITTKDAAIAYAKAWNNLDCSEFLELLDENAHYASQWVLDELKNKQAISDYLIDKMEAIKKGTSIIKADIGINQFEEDCVVISQKNEKQNTKIVVIFRVENNKIKRYDTCIPELYNVTLSEK